LACILVDVFIPQWFILQVDCFRLALLIFGGIQVADDRDR